MIQACFRLLLVLSFQEGIVSESLDTETVRDQFTEAIGKFNSVQRIESKPLFEQIVAKLENQALLDEEEHLIMTESLKYLGVITYPDETEVQFEKLIRFDPSYELSSKDFPPKIVAVFDGLKQNLVGRIRVAAMDVDDGSLLDEAGLLVDGRLVGPVHGETVFHVLAGRRVVEIRKANYLPATQELEVEPGGISEYQAAMTRNASGLVFVTVPFGTEVFMDGEKQGTATDEVPRGYVRKLSQMSVATEDAGAISINGVLPGTYTVTFTNPCHKDKVTTFQIDENKRWLFEPVQLEPAAAYLDVETVSDSSGIAFLDQDRVGFLPIKGFRVCPGSYELRVKFTDGEFIKQVSFEDGQRLTVTAEPLPSIAWFGLQEQSEGTPPEDIESWFDELSSWNVQRVDPDDTTAVPLNPIPILFGNKEISEENRGALARQMKSDLYMAARVVRKKVVIRHLEIVFWTPLSKKVHVASFDFREIGKFRELLQVIDRFPPLVMPWLGVQTAKLRDLDGCKIIEVHPNGPLADKVSDAEFIQTVNGNLFKHPGELNQLAGNDPVVLEVGGRQVEVVPVPSIAEVPFDPAATVPQALLAKFEKLAKYHPDPLVRQSALFNQARYQLFLGDYQQAFDIFSTLDLGAEFGINQGTLYYYQGLCFRRLKLAAEATAAFTKVLNYPNATLFNAYGPKAAFWAQAEMNNSN